NPDLLTLLRLLLSAVHVDEQWYLAQNPDIADAMRAGAIRSAKQHFAEHGYFEGRLPHRIIVDERWDLAENPDVAQAVQTGSVESAQHHFDTNGYQEGRLPSSHEEVFGKGGNPLLPETIRVAVGNPQPERRDVAAQARRTNDEIGHLVSA